MVDTGFLAKLLNKEEFVREYLNANVDPQLIQKEWNKIEQLFVLLYLEMAYDSLSVSDKTGLAINLSPNSTQIEIQNFTAKMAQFIQSHPDAINNELITKHAAEETIKQYTQHLKGKMV